MTTAELGEQRILKRVAEKMGEIHSLNIPMSKEPDWIWNCMQRWVSGLESIVNGSVQTNQKSSVLKKQMELMRTFDYVQEMAWIRSIIDEGDYPVVFCHNDLQEGNILMRQPSAGQNERTPRESISSLRWVELHKLLALCLIYLNTLRTFIKYYRLNHLQLPEN